MWPRAYCITLLMQKQEQKLVNHSAVEEKHFSLGINYHLLHKVSDDPNGKLGFFVLDVESANHAMREVRLNNGAVDRQAQNIHHSRSDNR